MSIEEDIYRLRESDKEMYHVVNELLRYVNSTYSDKYFEADRELDPNKFTLSSRFGMGFNIGNVVKYIQRYISSGYEKSFVRSDLMKAVHFLLIELKRTLPRDF